MRHPLHLRGVRCRLEQNCLSSLPLSCPGSRFKGFHPSTFTSSEPHTFPRECLHACVNTMILQNNSLTYGSRSHIMTISSSLPLASQRPECAHRTVNTGPVCIVRVQSDFGGLLESSEAGFRMGFVLQMRILASRPPVAIREPSGWTCTENIDKRFAFWSLFAESL